MFWLEARWERKETWFICTVDLCVCKQTLVRKEYSNNESTIDIYDRAAKKKRRTNWLYGAKQRREKDDDQNSVSAIFDCIYFFRLFRKIKWRQLQSRKLMKQFHWATSLLRQRTIHEIRLLVKYFVQFVFLCKFYFKLNEI